MMKSLSLIIFITGILILSYFAGGCSGKEDPSLQQPREGTFDITVSGNLVAEISGIASFEEVIVKSNQPGGGGSTLSLLLEAGKNYSLSIVMKKPEAQAFSIDSYIYSSINEGLRISMIFIDYDEVKTYEIASGSIEITRAGDEWIEGTVSGELTDEFAGSIMINGTFKAKGVSMVYN